MKLIKIENPDKNGEIMTTWALTMEQYHILLNFAINALILKGLIEVSEMSTEEAEFLQKEVEDEALNAGTEKKIIIN